MTNIVLLCSANVGKLSKKILTLYIVYCKIKSQNSLKAHNTINKIRLVSKMNEISKIRNELSAFIENNDNILTSDAVIKKSLETEFILASIIEN